MNDVKIGIGITRFVKEITRNKISTESIAWITAKAPKDATIVIVDDDSTIPFDYKPYNYWNNLTVLRNRNNLGVAKSKNRCIEFLLSKGCTDIFLFDDDCWIQDARYYYEYCYQDLPHMNLYPIEHINNPRKIISHFSYKNRHYIEAKPYGSCLYFKADLFDVVGGFNILFSRFGEEHGEMEERIHNQRYTPKESFDFYRPNEDYPVHIHPLTFHGQASSLNSFTKQSCIKEAQRNRLKYFNLKCPYKESEYEEFQKSPFNYKLS